jgi:hypothetical protein
MSKPISLRVPRPPHTRRRHTVLVTIRAVACVDLGGMDGLDA